MEFKDYYQALGVAKTASADEIKKAFRKLARESHPDLHAGDRTAEARFKDINEAYEVLGDPEKRRKYDELGSNWRMYEQAAQNGGAPFGQPWAGFGGGRTTHRTVSADELRDLFGTDDPFSDFFHTFFGGGGPTTGGSPRGTRTTRTRRGRDLEQPVDLTLEEAATGTSRRLVITGEGEDRSVEVRIPAGVKDGARVRAAGEGAPAGKGGQKGDLYLTVRLLPHRQFERKGQDLHTRVDIPVPIAVAGGEVSVPTLGGPPVRLKVPELTSQGRVFRLRGHGVQAVGKPGERGDLYATVHLTIPTRLTDEERVHYDALKQLDERART